MVFKNLRFLTALILMIFLLNFVNAVAVIQVNAGDQGLDIQYPKFDLYKQNGNFTYHFYVFNSTSGALMTNSSIYCGFHLYDSKGEHLFLNENVSYNPVNKEFEQEIDQANFTEIGNYAYLFRCQDFNNKVGGYVSVPILISNASISSTTSEAIYYLIVSFAVFIMFVFFLFFGIYIPYGNERDGKGQTIKINKMKYIKISCIFVAYPLFVWFLNTLIAISQSFISLPMYYGLFSFLFTLMINLTYPLMVVYFVFMAFNLLRDMAKAGEINKLGGHK